MQGLAAAPAKAEGTHQICGRSHYHVKLRQDVEVAQCLKPAMVQQAYM
jgi:hypothetical protein